MNRKERIYSYIKSEQYTPLKYEELKAVLEVPASADAEFRAILDALTEEGKIYTTRRGRYEASGNHNTITGTLRCNGFGFYAFLLPDDEAEEDVYINGEKLHTALDKDRVLVQIDTADARSGRREGHVLRILERGNKTLSGVVESVRNGKLKIKPDSNRIYAKLYAPVPEGLSIHTGDRVLADIAAYKPDGTVNVVVSRVLGDADSIKSNVEAILFANGIKTEFNQETLAQAQTAPAAVTDADIEGRLDLRKETIFTIDGADARDFDDAVSIQRLGNGNYKLGVHIADVSHYVRAGTPLDKEAFTRGTSVYLADRVIPMLPVALSNGICSLNPHVDRLTMSVFMEVDQNGGVVDFSLHEAVIRSAERMTYDDVAALLAHADPALEQKYAYLLPTLEQMADLAKILFQKRMDRGSINFDFPESKIIVNDAGEPIDIRRAERNDAHKLIEEFMLLANETIAEYAFWAELPFVYRVHDAPGIDKITEFNRFILNFGLSIKGKFDKDTPVHPKALQQILTAIEGTDEENMIATMMLRSLMKAEYRPENTGHFGLAAKYYCHFTSPIRRYPDLAIHRILKDLLHGNKDFHKYEKFTAGASVQSSETERNAELTERDVSDLMKAAYMEQFIGETFDAIIAGITNFGIFVQLENSVEGLIRLENIRDDFYVFDEDRRILTGERHGKTYQIGQAVRVALVKCSLLNRQIDFIFEEDATADTISAIHRRSRRQRAEKERRMKRAGTKPHHRYRKNRKNRKNGNRHGTN